jgi:preprotein translocase subunit SecE
MVAMLNPIEKIRTFYLDTIAELKKCSWPNWNDLTQSTLVVVVTAFVLSLFVFGTDIVIRSLVRFLT